jgi:hypothetical protein
MSRPKQPRSDAERDLTARIRLWEPKGWDDLEATWEDLIREHTSLSPEKEAKSYFQSSPITNQQAGRVFERWVIGAFKESGADVEYPFTVLGGQIPGRRLVEEHDGLLFDGWQGFLIQSKFSPKTTLNIEPITKLKAHVESRPTSTIGLFFSAFGISVPALYEAGRLRPVHLLIFQRVDILWAIKRRDILNLVKRRWQLAVKYGRIDYELDRDSK